MPVLDRNHGLENKRVDVCSPNGDALAVGAYRAEEPAIPIYNIGTGNGLL